MGFHNISGNGNESTCENQIVGTFYKHFGVIFDTEQTKLMMRL